jgi:hypothetical protein
MVDDYYMDSLKTLHTIYHESCHSMQNRCDDDIFLKLRQTKFIRLESQANLYANMYITLQMLQYAKQNGKTLTPVEKDIFKGAILECSGCNPETGYNDMLLSAKIIEDMLQYPSKYLNSRECYLENGEINIEGVFKSSYAIVSEQQTKRYREYLELPEIALIAENHRDRLLCEWFLIDYLVDMKNKENKNELGEFAGKLEEFLLAVAVKAKEKGLDMPPTLERFVEEKKSSELYAILKELQSKQNSIITIDEYKNFINELGMNDKFEQYTKEHRATAELRTEKKIILEDTPTNPVTQDKEEAKKILPKNDYKLTKGTQHRSVQNARKNLILEFETRKISEIRKREEERANAEKQEEKIREERQTPKQEENQHLFNITETIIDVTENEEKQAGVS